MNYFNIGDKVVNKYDKRPFLSKWYTVSYCDSWGKMYLYEYPGLGVYSDSFKLYEESKPSTALAVITRNERGQIEHWLFVDEDEMEKTLDECCTWRDKVICKKVIEWSEGEGL